MYAPRDRGYLGGMKTAPSSPSSRHLERSLAEPVATLFQQCPSLCGFCVAASGDELQVRELAIHPRPSVKELERVRQAIRAMLVEVMDQGEDACVWLRGRTFARALH